MACKTCIANSVGPTCKLCSNEGCSYHCYPGYTTCSGCTDGLVLETIFTNPILKKYSVLNLDPPRNNRFVMITAITTGKTIQTTNGYKYVESDDSN